MYDEKLIKRGRKPLTDKEKVLYAAEKPLTTETIARLAGISRITARKYLNNLQERDILEFKNKGINWWIAVDQKVMERERGGW